MVALRSVTLPSMPSLPHLNIARTSSQGSALASPKLTDGPVTSEPGSAGGTESVAQGLLRRSISSRGAARASEPGQPRRSASVAPSPVDDSAIAPETGGYVSKLALQLGERVNRVFPASAVQAGKDAVAWKGRLAPRADRGDELARFVMKCVGAVGRLGLTIQRTAGVPSRSVPAAIGPALGRHQVALGPALAPRRARRRARAGGRRGVQRGHRPDDGRGAQGPDVDGRG